MHAAANHLASHLMAHADGQFEMANLRWPISTPPSLHAQYMPVHGKLILGRVPHLNTVVCAGSKQIKKLQQQTSVAEQALGVPPQSIRQYFLADLYPPNKLTAMLAYAKPRGIRMLERSGRGISVITNCVSRSYRLPAHVL